MQTYLYMQSNSLKTIMYWFIHFEKKNIQAQDRIEFFVRLSCERCKYIYKANLTYIFSRKISILSHNYAIEINKYLLAFILPLYLVERFFLLLIFSCPLPHLLMYDKRYTFFLRSVRVSVRLSTFPAVCMNALCGR